MGKIIILISTTVIAINLLYTMLPGGSYEKHCKYIFGLILVLVFAGSIMKIDISSEVLNFDGNIPVNEDVKIIDIASQKTEALINDNIQNMLKSKRISVEEVGVKMEDNKILEVKVVASSIGEKDRIISLISSYCDINKENVVVE